MASHVQVVAPEDLPGGYELNCLLQGRATIVRVPPEGVRKGERFIGNVVHHQTLPVAVSVAFASADLKQDDDAAPDDVLIDEEKLGVPRGQWRDRWLDCCKHGSLHPICCLAYWFGPCALGQVMTRMRLDGCANHIPPGTPPSYWTAFKTMFFFYSVWIILTYVLATVYIVLAVKEESQSAVPIFIVVWLLSVACFVYYVVILTKTRIFIRHRYNIPGDCCGDCCLSYWCACCSTLQMARHTADYDRHPAACGTDTGLPDTDCFIEPLVPEMPRQSRLNK